MCSSDRLVRPGMRGGVPFCLARPGMRGGVPFCLALHTRRCSVLSGVARYARRCSVLSGAARYARRCCGFVIGGPGSLVALPDNPVVIGVSDPRSRRSTLLCRSEMCEVR